MLSKEKVVKACLVLLNEKISYLQTSIRELTEGIANDSKSSAGDKHETARALIQAEQEKLQKQLENIFSQKIIIEKIDVGILPKKVSNGSLIKTARGYLFLCIPLGKMEVDKTTVFAISKESPLGLKIMGLKVHDVAEVNGIRYLIEDIN